MVLCKKERPVGFKGNLTMGSFSQANGAVPNGIKNIIEIKTVTVSLRSWDKFLTVIKSAIPYLAFLFIYGINKQAHILPKYSDINCVKLYNISAMEYSLFHFQPHKLVSSIHNTFFDFLSAVPYLMHYVIPVLYPAYLYLRGQTDYISKFYWLLGWSMWAYFIIWFFLPTAPPWVYDNIEKFTSLNTTVPPLHLQHKEGCAFARLDKIIGLPFFFNMFTTNPVPFASFPSGHVSWPMCIFLTLPPGGRLFGVYVGWVSWATLYSCHHYLSDVLAAIFLTAGVKKILVWQKERLKTRDNLCGFQGVVCPLNMV